MVEEFTNIHLSSIMIFANGKKVFKPLTSGAVVDQDGEDGVVRVSWLDEAITVNIHFTDTQAAATVWRHLQKKLRKSRIKEAKQPPARLEQQRPTKAPRNTQDDIASFSMGDTLPGAVTNQEGPPAPRASAWGQPEAREPVRELAAQRQPNSAQREQVKLGRELFAGSAPKNDEGWAEGEVSRRPAKMLKLNAHLDTMQPRNEPLRSMQSAITSVLHMEPTKPSAPQRSSAYAGYRSSVRFEGLVNLGNTCYLNAVMQAVRSLREFTAALGAMCESAPLFGEGDLFRSTAQVLEQMDATSILASGPVSPAKVRQHIALSNPMFGNSGQQDAHEFFLEFVNQLHDELLERHNASVPPPQVALATHLWLDCEVKKSIVCCQCGHGSWKNDKFRDFSLDFCETGVQSLSRMICAYFADEFLDFRCVQCPATTARLEKHLMAPPRVLVFHLKRLMPDLQAPAHGRRVQHHRACEDPQLGRHVPEPLGREVAGAGAAGPEDGGRVLGGAAVRQVLLCGNSPWTRPLDGVEHRPRGDARSR